MDSDQGKLFIGGISWETSEDKLKEYFGKYGEVLQTLIMRDKNTGKPRGFGFVMFADPSILDRVLQDKHTIDGKTVEAKRALSREEQQNSSRSGNNQNAGRNLSGLGNVRTKKIFVGGLPPTLTEEGFRQYFDAYGHVMDVVVMYDQTTQRPRGFGFISFDSEDAVDRVLHKNFHEVGGKMVEVKRALPKDANPGSAARSGGSYQGYGSSGMNSNSYDGRMDGNRYMQSQAAAGGYPAYGSSGYGAPSYGYGAAGNGVGYGYGVGGYGGANAGYGAHPGAFGTPNAASGGYVGAPPGAPRSPWSNQPPSAYGSAAYGAGGGYGVTATWNNAVGAAAAGGAGPAPAGQSPSAPAGYGYGGYGVERSYGNQAGYGTLGGHGSSAPNSSGGGAAGEQQGAGAGYMSAGYGDVNGNGGYPNAVWRSDVSQGAGYGATQGNGPSGGQAGYGAGYSGPSRQAQQQ